jgi:uncharacterized protein (TIGR03546 family)
MISRQIGKIIRGNATPFQLFAACVLAGMLTFLPGISQAPGAIVALVFGLIILNANLPLGVLVGVIAKLAAIALTPASFAVGRFLLDGPTSGLFQSAINAPVLALFGFEYYTVTGGLAVGAVFGVVSGVVIAGGLTRFRRKMATLESSSEAFKKFSSAPLAKITTWIFLGGDAKKGSWEDVADKKIGLPIRPLGVVFVVLAGLLIFLVVQFGKGPIMTAVLRDGLEKANGATVDLENSEIDFKENKLTITGLAIADSANLDLDILRAAKLEADIGTASLLSKRLLLERVVIDSAKHAAKRSTRAYRVGPPPVISEPAPKKPEDGDAKSIDDYVKEAKVWKERLAKVKQWLEKLSGPEGEEGQAEPPKPSDGEAFEDWLKRQIEIAGYDGVRAEHLLTAAPTFTIGELIVNDLEVPQLPEEALAVKALNLTTHPWLLNAEKSIRITSAKDTLGAAIQLGGQSATNNANGFSFHYRGLPTDQVAAGIKFGGEQTLSGGTMDVSAAGTWHNAGGLVIDLPLQVNLHNVNIALPGGAGSQSIESLNIPIGLEGPLDNPRIKVDSKAFAEVVKQAALSKGKQILKDKVGTEIEKAIGDKVKLPGGAKGLLDSFLGGKK